MKLPEFKYHRDPVHSGSIEISDNLCRCCGERRGYLYTGPVYALEDLDDEICPWCIFEGAAHAMFDATFIDEAAMPDGLSDDVVQEVVNRTPGYSAWQAEKWFSCCEDAMCFLEPVGIGELRERYRELEFTVLGNIIYDLEISGGAAKRVLESLDRNAGPTAYVFQCTHCGRYQTFVDGIFDVEPS